MTINGKYVSPSALFQHAMAYAAIVVGVLTTQLQGIKLPLAGSIILGIFGTLLHPWTSVTSTTAPAQVAEKSTTPIS
jgi:hypothetical protein